ncbi:MAG: hypothetical protein AAFO07_22980, partial [Bacteroidota bacterium]
MRSIYPFWLMYFAVLLFLLQNCATPVAPTGGPRDEQPPQVVTSESTPNYQTNFVKQDIEL